MIDINAHGFAPLQASTVSMTVSTGSSRVQVRTSAATGANGAVRHIRVVNSGAAIVFIELGGSTVAAASATGMPIRPSADLVVSAQGDFVAAISSSAGQVVFFTPGEGGLS